MTFASCPPAPWSTAESWLCSLSVRPLGATRGTRMRGGPCQSRRNPCPFGVHSATDSCHGWPAFGSLIGARFFDGHPWTQQLTIDVVDAAHPATSCLPSPWLIHDELYLFRELRQDVRVLLRLRPDDLDMSRPGAGRVPEIGFPLAWSFRRAGARSCLLHRTRAFSRRLRKRCLSGPPLRRAQMAPERRRGLRSLIKRPRRTIRT